MPKVPLRLLLIEHGAGEGWTAHCLEHDLVAQAFSLKDVLREFERQIHGRLIVAAKLGVDPFEDIPPAPAEIHERYEHAPSLPVRELGPQFAHWAETDDAFTAAKKTIQEIVAGWQQRVDARLALC